MKKLLLLVMVLSIYSCRKESLDKGIMQQQNGSPEFRTTNNPYDWVGKMHNEGLDYLVARKGSWAFIPDSSAKANRIKITMSKFLMLQVAKTPPPGFDSAICTAAFRTFLDTIHYVHYYDAPVTIYGVLAKHYFDSIFTFNTETQTLNSIKTRIMVLEDEVIATSMLSERERAGLLLTASVLRNSLAYWSKVYQDGSGSNWYGLYSSAPTVGSIARADAEGAAVGLIYTWQSGAANGLLTFSPEGTIILYAGSALGGAFWSSVLHSLWDWIF